MLYTLPATAESNDVARTISRGGHVPVSMGAGVIGFLVGAQEYDSVFARSMEGALDEWEPMDYEGERHFLAVSGEMG